MELVVTMLTLASAVKATSETHEQSWDGTKYTLSIRDAAQLVHSSTDIQHLSYLLLTSCWNDALEWADKTLAE